MKRYLKKGLSLIVAIGLMATMLIPGGLLASASTPGITYTPVSPAKFAADSNTVQLEKKISHVSTDPDDVFKIDLTLTATPAQHSNPAYVVMLLDSSMSMESKVADVRTAADTFLDQVLSTSMSNIDNNHHVAMISYSSASGSRKASQFFQIGKTYENYTASHTYFTTNYNDLKKTAAGGTNTGVDQFTETNGTTNIQDALQNAQTLLDGVTDATAAKYIVLLTDGKPSLSYQAPTNGSNHIDTGVNWVTSYKNDSSNVNFNFVTNASNDRNLHSYSFALNTFSNSTVGSSNNYNLDSAYKTDNNSAYTVYDNGLATISQARLIKKAPGKNYKIFTIGLGINPSDLTSTNADTKALTNQEMFVLENIKSSGEAYQTSYYTTGSDISGLTAAFGGIAKTLYYPSVTVTDDVSSPFTIVDGSLSAGLTSATDAARNQQLNVVWNLAASGWDNLSGTLTKTVSYKVHLTPSAVTTYKTTGETAGTGAAQTGITRVQSTLYGNSANNSFTSSDQTRVTVGGYGEVKIYATLYDAAGNPTGTHVLLYDSVQPLATGSYSFTLPSNPGTIGTTDYSAYQLHGAAPTIVAPTIGALTSVYDVPYQLQVTDTIVYTAVASNGQPAGNHLASPDGSVTGFSGASLPITQLSFPGYSPISVSTPVAGNPPVTANPTSDTLGAASKTVYQYYTVDYVVQYYVDGIYQTNKDVTGTAYSGTTFTTATVPALVGLPANHTIQAPGTGAVTSLPAITGANLDATLHKVVLKVNYLQDTGTSLNVIRYLVNTAGRAIHSDGTVIGTGASDSNADKAAAIIGSAIPYTGTLNVGPVSIDTTTTDSHGTVYAQPSLTIGAVSYAAQGSSFGTTIVKDQSATIYVPYLATVNVPVAYVDKNHSDAKLGDADSIPATVGSPYTSLNLTGDQTSHTFNNKVYSYDSTVLPTAAIIGIAPATVNIRLSDIYPYVINYHFNDGPAVPLSGSAEYGTPIMNFIVGPQTVDPTADAGFRQVDPPPVPKTVGTQSSNNSIDVYFSDKYDYTVEYLFDGNADSTIKANASGSLSYDQPIPYTADATVTDSHGVVWKLDSVSNPQGKITTDPAQNEVIVRYVSPSSYTVHRYLNGTTTDIVDPVTVSQNIYNGQSVSAEPTGIPGYTITDATNKTQTLVIGADPGNPNNNIIFYYTANSAPYTVHYYLDGTTTKVADDKVVTTGKTGETVSEDAAAVTGYNLKTGTPSTQSLKLAAVTEGSNPNLIIFYYTAKPETYTVHYYVNGTTTKVADDKVVTTGVFGQTVTETDPGFTGYTLAAGVNATQTLKLADGANVIVYSYTANTTTIPDDSTPLTPGPISSTPAPSSPSSLPTTTITDETTPLDSNPHTSDRSPFAPIAAAVGGLLALAGAAVGVLFRKLRRDA